MAHEYAFDVTLLTVVRVKADSEERAREILKEFGECLDISLWADARNRDDLHGQEEIRFTEASAETPFDLFEVDGEFKE